MQHNTKQIKPKIDSKELIDRIKTNIRKTANNRLRLIFEVPDSKLSKI